MTVILSIETSTPVCSVALHQQGKLLGKSEIFLEKSHSGLLTAMIDQLMKNCKIPMSDLVAVAVSKGPGSYTGLRIGIATAKGLCYGLEIPLIGINTLEGLIQQIRAWGQARNYCAMLDARRMEVYTMMIDEKGLVVREPSAMVIDESSFKKELALGQVVFFGNGAMKCAQILQHDNATFLDGIQTSAADIGVLAYNRYNEGRFEDLAYFEPLYLKEFRTIRPKTAGL